MNVKRLYPKLILPDLDDVVSAWETPRDGDRFKILRVFFKSENDKFSKMPKLILKVFDDFFERKFPTNKLNYLKLISFVIFLS